MIKIDLITGFLGAGKTTFLKIYAKYLIEQGNKICIIENDFGAINVDMVLLQELISEKCNLEMIVGGDGAAAHKRRLKTKLISLGMMGYDRVIIEPSGIFDPDEFFDLLYEEPLDRWYEIGNVIAIADAGNVDDFSKESRYLLMSETACAGMVVLSKITGDAKLASDTIKKRLNDIMLEFGCTRRITDDEILTRNWDNLSKIDFDSIIKCGFNKASYPKLYAVGNTDYQTLFYFDFTMDKSKLSETVPRVFEDKSCGEIIRIKGIIQTSPTSKMELNATKSIFSTREVNDGLVVLIIIGEHLNKENIKKYFGEPSI